MSKPPPFPRSAMITAAPPYPPPAPPRASAPGGPAPVPPAPQPAGAPGAPAGHHRSWQVHRLPAGASRSPGGRVKTGEPHLGVPRFDPRCVLDEDGLLRELARRGVPRVPRAHQAAPGLQTHDYIEGHALSALRPPGTWLTGRQLGDIMQLFGHLGSVGPVGLGTLHSCPPFERPRSSNEFLWSLLRFTRTRVYRRHAPLLPGLFAGLGIRPEAVAAGGPLGRAAARLTGRPFCLLHADLHRDNLIVADADSALWTIDWELALIGDPLYDLATHLHLMRYPRAQEGAVINRWAHTMEAVLPGAAAGLDTDLTRYLKYKRVQSAITDAVRNADAVRAAPPERLPEQLAATATEMHHILARAAAPLGLLRVPTAARIERSYAALRTDAPLPRR
ncbi:aminoglycoside phosphotransferase family protein [Streptomyces otsuchiensis]|uniref:aminoglycoside phosphotransferase family protein n=1 Tax=Streptomyces otsuchiensis TaxID=2681388 RepID=UPI0010317968|nr:aminoglycoside phosphotransferase family protein [Streptomyces otsuchiensis]